MFALKSLALMVAMNAVSLSPDLNREKAGMQECGQTISFQKLMPESPESCSAGFALNQERALPLLQKQLGGGYQSLPSWIEGVKSVLSWLPAPPGIDSLSPINMHMAQVLPQRDLLKDYPLTG